MTTTKLGVLLWNQATEWAPYEAAAKRVDELSYDSLWAWDHLYAIFGFPYQPIFEGYTSLAAWARVTSRVKLGLLVGAVPFRSPAVVAKMLTTIDHASGGRAIAGMGGAWFDLEHEQAGIDFGTSVGQRLDWLEETCAALETLFAGQPATSPPDGHYQLRDFVLLPRPIQQRLPIMIGGGGEKKTLRTVARHADLWNVMGSVESLRRKVEILHGHCEDVGRDPAEIELTAGCKPIIRDSLEAARRVWGAQMTHNRTPMADVLDDDTFWVGPPDLVAERMAERKALGFHTFLAEMAAPYDDETLERWIGEVRPMVDGAP
ncbi:MAG TPA: LLM class flavin-dependent oxidoreductase [Candidatus Limnocylindrales bacterium]|nr:LLM class flavin-dependent oxidoreductase [Candidatus Limnocylindrales bacterium]